MITSTAEWGKQAISIGLDDNDARKIMGAESWDAMSFKEQIDWLSKRTDLEVLAYLRREDAITDDYLHQRAKEIKTR